MAFGISHRLCPAYIEIGGVTLLALGIDMFAESVNFAITRRSPARRRNIIAEECSNSAETTIRRISDRTQARY